MTGYKMGFVSFVVSVDLMGRVLIKVSTFTSYFLLVTTAVAKIHLGFYCNLD